MASSLAFNVSLSRGSAAVRGAVSTPMPIKVVDVHTLFPSVPAARLGGHARRDGSIPGADRGGLGAGAAATPVHALGATPAGLPGLVGWYDAGSLTAAGLANGSRVSTWPNQLSGPRALGPAAQPVPARQPLLVAAAVGGKPAVWFDGDDDGLLGAVPTSGAVLSAKTIAVVVKATARADACCSGIVTLWDNSTGAHGGDLGASTNGIALKRAERGVFSVLDYAGENNQGLLPLAGTPSSLVATFGPDGTRLAADGCTDVDLGAGGTLTKKSGKIFQVPT